MKKSYKYIHRGGKVFVVRHEIALFGAQWSEIGAFDESCLGRCRQIVRLLNECNEMTDKNNDRE